MTRELAPDLIDRALDDLRADRTFAVMVGHALDQLESRAPSPAWAEYRTVDLDAEVRATSGAIRDAIATRPPPAAMTGVWFGLYELGDDDQPAVEAVVALTGHPTYPDEDWLFHDVWAPPGYLATPGLSGLAATAERAPTSPDADGLVTYGLTFVWTVGLVAEVVRGPIGAVLLGDRPGLGVAAGFHDGDITLVGDLGPDGLDTRSVRWT